MQKPSRRLLLASAVGALALALTATVVTVQANAEGSTLTHAQAAARLKAADISVWSSRNCSDKNGKGCTSFTGIRTATINGVIGLKRASGCDITITGGTEAGHSTKGKHSHGNGYKVDLRLTDCVTHYIERHATRGPDRGDDHAPQWTAAGVTYAKETAKHHWDITYTGGSGASSSPGKPTSSGSWPVLREGAQGAQGAHGAKAATVQSLLNASGAKVAVDGRYGPATANAVRAFQNKHHLTADGVTGPDTWRGLLAG